MTKLTCGRKHFVPMVRSKEIYQLYYEHTTIKSTRYIGKLRGFPWRNGSGVGAGRKMVAPCGQATNAPLIDGPETFSKRSKSKSKLSINKPHIVSFINEILVSVLFVDNILMTIKMNILYWEHELATEPRICFLMKSLTVLENHICRIHLLQISSLPLVWRNVSLQVRRYIAKLCTLRQAMSYRFLSAVCI